MVIYSKGNTYVYFSTGSNYNIIYNIIQVCVVYVVKEVASYIELGQIMAMAHNGYWMLISQSKAIGILILLILILHELWRYDHQ